MQKGFSLIELMIVIIIVAILAAIALPMYRDHVKKTNRVDAQTQLMEISNQLQRYKIANFTFVKANGTPLTLVDLGRSTSLKIAGAELYNLTLNNVTVGTWTLTATPINASRQVGDGELVLNSRGERCWTKGTSCIPTATSNWDGK